MDHRLFCFKARQERGENIYFLCSTAYTVPTQRGVGEVETCKLLICGGPCRGRTYGPLIKSSVPPQSETTQDELSAGNTKESEKSSS